MTGAPVRGGEMISTREMAARAGVNYRQLSHWNALGLFAGAPGFEAAELKHRSPGLGWVWPESAVERVAAVGRVSRSLAYGTRAAPTHGILRLVLEFYDEGFVELDDGIVLDFGGL